MAGGRRRRRDDSRIVQDSSRLVTEDVAEATGETEVASADGGTIELMERNRKRRDAARLDGSMAAGARRNPQGSNGVIRGDYSND